MLSEFVECTFGSGGVATAAIQPKFQLLLCPFSITVSGSSLYTVFLPVIHSPIEPFCTK